MIQYSFLGRTAASIRLNTTVRGLAPSPSSGKTDLTYNSSVPRFSTWRGREAWEHNSQQPAHQLNYLGTTNRSDSPCHAR
jgi:hypothetical protein